MRTLSPNTAYSCPVFLLQPFCWSHWPALSRPEPRHMSCVFAFGPPNLVIDAVVSSFLEPYPPLYTYPVPLLIAVVANGATMASTESSSFFTLLYRSLLGLVLHITSHYALCTQYLCALPHSSPGGGRSQIIFHHRLVTKAAWLCKARCHRPFTGSWTRGNRRGCRRRGSCRPRVRLFLWQHSYRVAVGLTTIHGVLYGSQRPSQMKMETNFIVLVIAALLPTNQPRLA